MGIDLGNFFNNSRSFSPSILPLETLIVTYITIAVSIVILIHSSILHSSLKYNSVRLQTELACIAALLAALFSIISILNSTTIKSAILYDVFAKGIFNLIPLLCDNYMFYYRLLAIRKLSKRTCIFIHFYIWIVTTLWIPSYTFIPLFFNTDDAIYLHTSYISESTVSGLIVLYNFCFTYEFSRILYSIYHMSEQWNRIKIVGHIGETSQKEGTVYSSC